MSTKTGTIDAQSTRQAPARGTEVLIVGTLGGGGIHHYVDEQATRLPAHLSVAVYDMASDSTGSGVVWFVVSLLRSLWAAIKFPFRRPPDVVHVHSSHRFSFYRASFYVLFVKYVWRRPVILHIHGSSFDDFAETDNVAIKWLQTTVFTAVDRIVVLSDYWRDVISPSVADEKIEVLPNAVDPDEYDPQFDRGIPHVVFVSNLIERKGVHELLAAIEALDERDITYRVTIAGKGPLTNRVESLASRSENLDYVGYVSEERKRELLSAATIFVLPAYAEGLPIAMLEGMAGGNAIVSTTVGSIPEVIDDESGILLEPGDSDGLADALDTLVSDPARARRMGRRNRSLVERQYSWDRTTDRLARIYADLSADAPPDRTLARP